MAVEAQSRTASGLADANEANAALQLTLNEERGAMTAKMEKMRRENPELFANMGDMGNFYGGGGGARVIPDCRFRKTDTESVRKFGGIEWLSCTTK